MTTLIGLGMLLDDNTRREPFFSFPLGNSAYRPSSHRILACLGNGGVSIVVERLTVSAFDRRNINLHTKTLRLIIAQF
jgi:hypothetical protein